MTEVGAPVQPGGLMPTRRMALFWALVAAEAAGLALMAAGGGFRTFTAIHLFVAGFTLAGVAFFGAATAFPLLGPRLRPGIFWTIAIGLRVLALAIPPGDDVWRYLWEGMIQHAGFNPYDYAPDARALAALRNEWWLLINHRDWPAIYPPGAQWMFRAVTGLSVSVPAMKLVFALFDLGTIFLLLRVRSGAGRYRMAAWYAWCPLAVYSAAGGTHFDSVMAFFLVAACWALHRSDPLSRGAPAMAWILLGGVLLGLAISIKAVPVLLLPLLAFHFRWRAALLVPVALAIPLLLSLQYGFPHSPVLDNLRNFLDVARTADLVWWIAEPLAPVAAETKNAYYAILLLPGVVAAGFVFRHDWLRGALWVLGLAILLSPVFHPWYLVWLLPLATWNDARGWHVLSVSSAAYFLLWEKSLAGQPWEMEWTWRLWMLLPPVCWMVLQRLRRERK